MFKSLFLCLLLIAAPVEATTYYVDNGNNKASNSNACTSLSLPCRTIEGGLTKMAGGDQLLVANGTYTEPIRLEGWPSGSATLYTRIQALNNKGAIIQQGDLFFYGATTHHIIMDGFVIKGGGLLGMTNGSHHIEFNNGEIANSNQSCVFSDPQNSTDPNGASGNALRNNWIHGCGKSGLDHGVYWSSPNGFIERNEISVPFGYCIQIQYKFANSNEVKNNKIHDCAGIILSSDIDDRGGPGAHDNRVYNNLIYSASNGIIVSFGGASNSNNNTVVQNTIVNSFGPGIQMGQSGSGNIIRNNIVYNSAGGDFVVLGTPSYTASNNLCTATATGCQYGGNPLFVSSDPLNANFLKLQSASPAIGKALTLGSPYNLDYAGVDRNTQGTGWDIGAFEYVGTVPPPKNCTVTLPQTLSTGTISATVVCN